MTRKISQVGIDLIKSFEGCRLVAYKAVSTEVYYTIGYGHYGVDVKAGMVITQEIAEIMLVNDLAKYEAYVNQLNILLNQNQFDALVSFCYNCGVGNLKDLCVGHTIEQIGKMIPLYNKARSVVLNGLVRRRIAEQQLFNKKDVIIVQDWAFDFIESVMGNYWERMKGNEEVQQATNMAMNELRKATGRKEE